MNRKLKLASVFCIGATAAIFIVNASSQHQVATALASQIHPVCDFAPAGKDAPPSVSETAGVEPVSPESGTLTPPMLDAAPEPQPITEPEETSQPQPFPVAPMQSASSPPVAPKMGDTRSVDGQKQVYFLGFGWIEDNDTPNECTYVDDMYENGNKVGSMGGGTFVDGEGDIDKMVGSMDRGEVGRSCGDINKMVGIMGE